jgi:serine protease
MKKIVLSFLILALSSTLVAATPTQRYVVATRASVGSVRAALMIRDIESAAAPTPMERDVTAFSSIDGFAADLTDAEVAALRKSPSVQYVEPVAERHAFGLGAIASNTDAINPNGQVVPFGIDLVRAREVWPVTRGEGINVVVIDTGIDYNHPDLARFYAGGYNTYDKTDKPLDDEGHGTHVAGTIAAADNNIGVVGVAPNVKLWAVKVLDKTGSGTTDKIIAGLDWVLAKQKELGGDWIINLSLGSNSANTAERTAFGKAVDAGLLIIAASGNKDPESTLPTPDPVGYPAAYRDVLAIGAVDQLSAIASFSNQGPQLAVVAPGVNVLSNLPVGTGPLVGVSSSIGAFNAADISLSKKGSVTASFVSCGLGRPSDFPSGVAGKIAVIQRGTLTFNEKAHNAVNAGAVGIIIYNNDTSELNWTLSNSADPGASSFDWPVTVAMAKADGEALIAGANGAITITDGNGADYGVESGTSMATPHAVGVAALVWSLAPNVTSAAIRSALDSTASDLGDKGFDNVFGNGLIDALSAAKFVAPGKFGTPASPQPVPTNRRHAAKH